MDKVLTPPSSIGTRGRFWDIPLDRVREGRRAADDCTIAICIVEAPYANMTSHSFVMSIIHLRSIPGVPPAAIHMPGATHEIMISPLDPKKERELLVSGREFSRELFNDKVNFVGQVILTSDVPGLTGDDMAHDLLLKTAQDIADAKLNPDKDYRRHWVARFGAHCMKPGWDEWSDKILVGDREVIIPLRPYPGEVA